MRASAIAVALALLLAAGGAGAGPVEVERAKALFRAGASAYKAGNFAAAVLAFEQAHDLDPKPAIRFSTAQALRRWFAKSEDPSHLQRALAYYREYLDEVKTGGRVLDASRAKNEIEILLAQLGVPLSPTPAGEGEGGDDGSGSDGSARARPPARHNGLGTLMVDGPELAGHRVVVDGQEQSGWPVFVELSPGRHDVLVEAPGYRPLARTTTAVAGQLTLVDAELDELPATLSVRGDDGAEIIVDGRPMGRTPLPQPLELSPGPHRVVVGTPGREVMVRDVDLARGTHTPLTADLDVTAQRVAAWCFFGGAILGTGVGVTFAIVAVSGRSHAKNILDTAAEEGRPLSLAEAEDYNDALGRRDDYTRAAGISLTASALTAGVGLLLYVLDAPDLYEAAAGDVGFDIAPPPSDLGPSRGGLVQLRGRF